MKLPNGKLRAYLLQLVLSLSLGLAFGVVLILSVGENPVNVYTALIQQGFFTPLGLGITIQRATPLILTAAAAVLAFRGGAINMGIEGQFAVGASIAALVGNAVPQMPGLLAVPFVLFFCALAGALAGWVPAFFRMVSGVSEVITGMIANLVVPPLLSLVLSLPFIRLLRAPDAGRGIQPWAQLAQFKDLTEGAFGANTRANTGIFVAIIISILLAVLIKRTRIGYEMHMSAANFSLAEISGINARRSFYITLMFSGAIAAIAGATEVLGTWQGGGGGLANTGYNGLLLALAGGNNYIGSMVAATVYGGLQSGSLNASWSTNIPRPLIDVLVEVIVVFAAIPSMRLFFSGSGHQDTERLGGQFTHKEF